MERRTDAAVYDRDELEATYDSLARLRYGTARVEDIAEGAVAPVAVELFENGDVGQDTITVPFEEYAEYMEDLETVVERADPDGGLRAVTDRFFETGYDEMDERIADGDDLQELYEEVQEQERSAVRAAAGVKGGPVVGLGAGYAIDPVLSAPGALLGLGAGLAGVIARQYRVSGRSRRVTEELAEQELTALADHRIRVPDRDGKTWSPDRAYGSEDDERDWDQQDVEDAIERLQSLEDM